MDSGRKESFLSHRLLLLLLLLTTTLLLSADSSSASASSDQSEKVTLALYYETLCPYCSNFIVNYLINLFDDDGLLSIVDLKLLPYGNAKIGSNRTITCQHGPSECLLNTVEACAIHVWPDLTEHFPFIYCIETLIYEDKTTQWESCFEKLGLDPTPVADCYSSGYGNEIELGYAAETNALQPPHKFVPWVVVDGQPLYDDYRNFTSYICKAYKGTAVPTACIDSSLNTIPEENEIPIHPGCYTEETTKSTPSRIRSAVKWWMRQVNMVASV
uniref:Putative gamma-interferon-inducible lysosomal thiol reductase isoform X1 n=1 Tax=Davidia involucrata TaxID=16924 RepID=A0A5B7A6R3_DAVIN